MPVWQRLKVEISIRTLIAKTAKDCFSRFLISCMRKCQIVRLVFHPFVTINKVGAVVVQLGSVKRLTKTESAEVLLWVIWTVDCLSTSGKPQRKPGNKLFEN